MKSTKAYTKLIRHLTVQVLGTVLSIGLAFHIFSDAFMGLTLRQGSDPALVAPLGYAVCAATAILAFCAFATYRSVRNYCQAVNAEAKLYTTTYEGRTGVYDWNDSE